MKELAHFHYSELLNVFIILKSRTAFAFNSVVPCETFKISNHKISIQFQESAMKVSIAYKWEECDDAVTKYLWKYSIIL